MEFLNWIVAHGGEFVAIFTGLVTIASILAQMTPNQTDDGIVAWLGKVVNFLALNWGLDKKPADPNTPAA